MFPAFNLFGNVIGSYSLCAVMGMLICGIVIGRLGRRYKLDSADIVVMLGAVFIGLTVGGHILYGITNIDKLVILFKNIRSIDAKTFFSGLIIVFGGSVFYGGFIGGLFAVKVLPKFYKYAEKKLIMDFYALATPLFHCFGRIGCFFGGCCYGIESKFGFTAHGNIYVPELNDVCRFPVQLVEAVCNLLIFGILFILFKKRNNPGKLIYRYMLIYPPIRFSLEFLRGDSIRGFLFGLSTSQWISIALFIVAIIKIISEHSKHSGEPNGKALC